MRQRLGRQKDYKNFSGTQKVRAVSGAEKHQEIFHWCACQLHLLQCLWNSLCLFLFSPVSFCLLFMSHLLSSLFAFHLLPYQYQLAKNRYILGKTNNGLLTNLNLILVIKLLLRILFVNGIVIFYEKTSVLILVIFVIISKVCLNDSDITILNLQSCLS